MNKRRNKRERRSRSKRESEKERLTKREKMNKVERWRWMKCKIILREIHLAPPVEEHLL